MRQILSSSRRRQELQPECLAFQRFICYAECMQKTFISGIVFMCLFVLGCDDNEMGEPAETPSPHACDAAAPATRTISCVQSFESGDAAGYGADQFPQIIYGEPLGNGDTAGGIDVLSLGRQGVITVGFGGNTIVDQPGVDFIVFENPFRFGASGEQVFSELGEVSVSSDGQTWVTFPCAANAMPPTGCAGYEPVFANGDIGISSVDPSVSGGDQFDLETIGVSEARFVRIRDVQSMGAEPTAGFDLDAVSIVHASVE
jgi:hypothetical protein